MYNAIYVVMYICSIVVNYSMTTKQQLEQTIKIAKEGLSEIARDDKAKELVDSVSIFDKHTATVQAGENKTYTIEIQKQTCDCPDHQYRGKKCKHIRAVNMFLAELLETEEGETE